MIKPEIKLVVKMTKDKNLSGNCITFGVQGIEEQYASMEKILMDEHYDYRKLNQDEITYDNITKHGTTISQDVFFKMLGFSEVDSIDYFPNEKPTYVADLNKPVGLELQNQYDMVFDGGTTEHCFDTRQVLSNAIRLLKVGGRVVHLCPISGGINHGYFLLSPILFFDFYGQNGFKEMEARIAIIGEDRRSYWFEYEPSMFLPVDFYGKFALILFTAKKAVETKNIKVPIQGVWLNKFAGKGNVNDIKIDDNGSKKLKSTLKSMLKTSPLLYSLSKEIWSRYMLAIKIKKRKLT
jgi:SAM-dependent methyltransferase